MSHEGFSWVSRLFYGALLAWSVLLLFLHIFGSQLACGQDTSYCATSNDKNGTYHGVLTNRNGQTVRNARFQVAFGSRRHADPRLVSGFSTDRSGRYCIVWAQDSTPYAYVEGSEVNALTYNWEPLGGADPPADCEEGDQGIPWDRARTVTSNWRVVAVELAGVLTSLLLLHGIRRRREAGGRRSRRVGLLLTVALTAAVALLWFA